MHRGTEAHRVARALQHASLIVRHPYHVSTSVAAASLAVYRCHASPSRLSPPGCPQEVERVVLTFAKVGNDLG